MKRRVILAIAAVVLAAVAIVYGRAEGAGAVKTEQRALLAARAAVGDRLMHPDEAIYDPGGALECLTYPVNGNLFALELCFDAQGRLVEAVDRRSVERISSFRWGPQHAPFRISPQALDRAANSVPPGVRLEGLVP